MLYVVYVLGKVFYCFLAGVLYTYTYNYDVVTWVQYKKYTCIHVYMYIHVHVNSSRLFPHHSALHTSALHTPSPLSSPSHLSVTHTVWTMVDHLENSSSFSLVRSSIHTMVSLSTRPMTPTPFRSAPPPCSFRTTWTGSDLQGGWWGWSLCKGFCWMCSLRGLSTRPLLTGDT